MNRAEQISQMLGEVKETVYKEFSGNKWNFYTYAEGRRLSISKKQYSTMVKQGAKEVIVEAGGPLAKAVDLAKEYRTSGDKKILDKIRKALSSYPKDELEAWIKQHTTDSGKKGK